MLLFSTFLDVARELELADTNRIGCAKEQLHLIVGGLIGLGKRMERNALASPLPVPSEA